MMANYRRNGGVNNSCKKFYRINPRGTYAKKEKEFVEIEREGTERLKKE